MKETKVEIDLKILKMDQLPDISLGQSELLLSFAIRTKAFASEIYC